MQNKFYLFRSSYGKRNILQRRIGIRTLEYKTDLCITGGGMAGLCCGVAAARHGKDKRDGGIIEEIMLENFYQNPSLKYSL